MASASKKQVKDLNVAPESEAELKKAEKKLAKAAKQDEKSQKKAEKKAEKKAKKAAKKKKLYEVRDSGIHGRGVFAIADIPKGTRIVEYKGKVISYKKACKLYPDVDGKPTHTFLFEIDEKTVIDGGQKGSAARWINHSCDPNCEAEGEGDRIFIGSIRDIKAGEELGYDYGITLEERHTPKEKKRWPCYCGTKKCRGTLLAKKT
ncbi:MAG TPA: SET domain-containing protein-lysine N-methyltransferase [Burkholderiales bacterium]|nr:SET domain-containing protein-lysine N-methyltransferase [Burkholderiales bacterium]